MSIILYFALTILVMCGIFLGIRRLDTGYLRFDVRNPQKVL